MPHIPGHEFAGVVAEIGAGVTRFPGRRPGDGAVRLRLRALRVLPVGQRPGVPGPDPAGLHRAGVVRRAGPRSTAADVNLVRLPDTLDFVAAAALGCRFATAYRALIVHGRIAAGQWLAVFGCGGLGLSAIMIGVALGARVLAVDVVRRRAAAGGRAGRRGHLRADLAADLAGRIHEITGGGAHVTIDAVGSPALAAAGVRSLRRRGRHVQVGLLLGEHAITALPMDLVISRELEIYGSHGMPAADYPAMLDAVTAGVLHPGGWSAGPSGWTTPARRWPRWMPRPGQASPSSCRRFGEAARPAVFSTGQTSAFCLPGRRTPCHLFSHRRRVQPGGGGWCGGGGGCGVGAPG